MTPPPANLSAFLERVAAAPFEDGTSDCLLTVADWVAANGRPDPAAPFRGRYRTAFGRERILRRAGGLVAVADAGAARAGLGETTDPVPGDVGVVEMGGRTLAAICVGQLWAAKGAGLVIERPDRVIRAWRI